MGNLILRGCKTIAEYAFRRWMEKNGFVDGHVTLEVTGNEGIVKDGSGDTLKLIYDSETKSVYAE